MKELTTASFTLESGIACVTLPAVPPMTELLQGCCRRLAQRRLRAQVLYICDHVATAQTLLPG
jgi:hypothetical protein